MIRFERVSKSYGKRRVRALNDVDLTIPEGEILGLIGPNGAGKTTFVRLLLGLVEPTSGRITIPEGLRPGSSGVACVLDGDGVYADLTVRDNLRFFGGLYGLDAAEAEAKGGAILSRFGLGGKIDAPAGTLSLGQRKLAALCRAMVTNPALLVADELTASLDPSNRIILTDYLREVNREEGTTIIFSSHDLHQVEALADHVVLIEGGRVKADVAVDSVARSVCLSVSTSRDHSERVRRSLQESSFQLRQVSPTSFRILLEDPQKGESEARSLLSSFEGCRIESRPATLEDMYQVYSHV